jgi:ABC-type iron transport system FetAB permease component
MELKIELFLVWGFSLMAIFTQANVMFLLACAASITTIIRNYPAVREFIKSLKKK